MTKIKILSDSEINNIIDELQGSNHKKKKPKSSSRGSSSRGSSSRGSSSRGSSKGKIKSLKKHIKKLRSDFLKLFKNTSKTITKKNISLKKGLRMINRELNKIK